MAAELHAAESHHERDMRLSQLGGLAPDTGSLLSLSLWDQWSLGFAGI